METGNIHICKKVGAMRFNDTFSRFLVIFVTDNYLQTTVASICKDTKKRSSSIILLFLCHGPRGCWEVNKLLLSQARFVRSDKFPIPAKKVHNIITMDDCMLNYLPHLYA